MDIDQELARGVRTWLHEDEPASASRILGNVLPGIEAIPQHRARRFGRPPFGVPSDIAVVLVAAVFVVAVAVVGRLASDDASVAAPSDPRPTTVPATSAATPPPAGPDDAPTGVPPGGFAIPWAGGAAGGFVSVTVPGGWGWLGATDEPGTLFKRHGGLYGFPVDVQASSVSTVVTSLCAADPTSSEVGPTFVEAGSSVEDLVLALQRVDGARWAAPVDVAIDGYRARRLDTTGVADCPGPARRWLWEGGGDRYFVEDLAVNSVIVVDVDGRRLVLGTHARSRATAEDRAELEAILASIDITPGTDPVPDASPSTSAERVFPSSMGPDGDLRVGRHQARIGGIGFTFEVADRGWEPQLGFTITRSTEGSQAAEGIVRWTATPRGAEMRACDLVLDPGIGPSAGSLAAAMASAPGVDVITAPQEVVVGGRPAMHVVVEVATDVGCDPGYFSTYDAVDGGAMWLSTEQGDRILVWIVEVGDAALVIEGEVRSRAGPRLEDQLRAIVDSMAFE